MLGKGVCLCLEIRDILIKKKLFQKTLTRQFSEQKYLGGNEQPCDTQSGAKHLLY